MDKKSIERVDLNALLSCLARLDKFQPSSIDHKDKPDFIISNAGKNIGVETTRAVSQEMVRARKLHFSECPNLWIDVTHLKDRELRRSNKELLASMTNPLPQWKKSKESALEWKNKIAKVLRSKRKKYNRIDFQKFDKNWLLITDDPPLPASDLWKARAERHLNALFREPIGVAYDFDTVFVCSGQFLFRWRNQELHLADTKLVGDLNLTNLAT
jgi:hypothetical protein